MLKDYLSYLRPFEFDEDPVLDDRDRSRFRYANSKLRKEFLEIGHLHRMRKRVGSFPFESIKYEFIESAIDRHILKADFYMERIGAIYFKAKNEFK